MQVVSVTSGIVDAIRPSQGLRDLKKAGFESICLNLADYCHAESLWPGDSKVSGDALRSPETIRNGYNDFWKNVADLTLQAKMGILPNFEFRRERRKELVPRVEELCMTCLPALEQMGCEMILVDFMQGDGERQSEKALNHAFLLKLAQTCLKSETKILLKNGLRDIGGHFVRGICSEPEEAVEWLSELNKAVGMERFGFCLDVGACNICGQDMHEVITALGNYLDVVAVRENDGRRPDSFLPFCGHDVEWLGMIRGLREILFDGVLLLDCKTTALAFSPLLKPGLLQMAKSIGDFLKWQIEMEAAMKRYDSIVLFGAGNMCRNYMKNYGEAYPPLFTCDNNPDRWGEIFCGLEIKSPEALRNLPDNCGIFICNVYYREIEEQLRSMGVKNIEYFNDEYMATFHMDRLERR